MIARTNEPILGFRMSEGSSTHTEHEHQISLTHSVLQVEQIDDHPQGSRSTGERAAYFRSVMGRGEHQLKLFHLLLFSQN
jgi:hypothetical protein